MIMESKDALNGKTIKVLILFLQTSIENKVIIINEHKSCIYVL
jgi:hypothetical protein